jgi:hypothetical protein
MIDSSTILLVIAMHTPMEYLDAERNDVYTDIDSLDNVMQRLCWPDSRTLNRKCESTTIERTSANN